MPVASHQLAALIGLLVVVAVVAIWPRLVALATWARAAAQASRAASGAASGAAVPAATSQPTTHHATEADLLDGWHLMDQYLRRHGQLELSRTLAEVLGESLRITRSPPRPSAEPTADA